SDLRGERAVSPPILFLNPSSVEAGKRRCWYQDSDLLGIQSSFCDEKACAETVSNVPAGQSVCLHHVGILLFNPSNPIHPNRLNTPFCSDVMPAPCPVTKYDFYCSRPGISSGIMVETGRPNTWVSSNGYRQCPDYVPATGVA